MNRHTDLVQRMEQRLYPVGQLVRRCGEGHKGRADDQVNGPDRHIDGRYQAALRDRNDPGVEQYVSASRQKQIK